MHSLSIYENTKELTRGTTTINKFCISALRQYVNVHVLEYNSVLDRLTYYHNSLHKE